MRDIETVVTLCVSGGHPSSTVTGGSEVAAGSSAVSVRVCVEDCMSKENTRNLI